MLLWLVVRRPTEAGAAAFSAGGDATALTLATTAAVASTAAIPLAQLIVSAPNDRGAARALQRGSHRKRRVVFVIGPNGQGRTTLKLTCRGAEGTPVCSVATTTNR